MSDLDLNSKQWCELVFDGKNTEFGAFQMRQGSTSRHNKAMIIVAILVVLIITLPALFRYIAPKKQEEVKKRIKFLCQIRIFTQYFQIIHSYFL